MHVLETLYRKLKKTPVTRRTEVYIEIQKAYIDLLSRLE